MRSLLAILFAVLATFVVTLAPALASFTAVAASVRALQAPITDDAGNATLRNICTVTSINADQHYWLTAAHCVMPEMVVAGHIAYAVRVDKDTDLAILYTEHYALPAVLLRRTPPQVDQPVMMAGHPFGLPQVQVFRGRISSVRTFVDDGDYMMFDMTACGGNSGSAVVDEHDQVVSVLQIGFGPGCSAFSGGAVWDAVVKVAGEYFEQ